MVECPTCGADVVIGKGAEKGEIIVCPDCGTELEVTGSNSVREAPKEEEDWG